MAEKIERLELQSESKDKVRNPHHLVPSHDISITLVMLVLQQVIDLQELYNAQKLLTAELSEKLDKTEVQILLYICVDRGA